MDDLELRRHILRHFAETGEAPDHSALMEWGIDAPAEALRRLHDGHAVVLGATDRIVMANPFSGIETQWRVQAGTRSWYANCAWDAIAIPIAVRLDARIHAPWMDQPGDVDLAVTGGQVEGGAGFVHFEVPARHWWDDIVHT